jgi:hypothetical protein
MDSLKPRVPFLCLDDTEGSDPAVSMTSLNQLPGLIETAESFTKKFKSDLNETTGNQSHGLIETVEINPAVSLRPRNPPIILNILANAKPYAKWL